MSQKVKRKPSTDTKKKIPKIIVASPDDKEFFESDRFVFENSKKHEDEDMNIPEMRSRKIILLDQSPYKHPGNQNLTQLDRLPMPILLRFSQPRNAKNIDEASQLSRFDYMNNYFEADLACGSETVEKEIEPFQKCMVYLSFSQFLESLIIHLAYTLVLGPFLYILCIPFRKTRNYIMALSLISFSIWKDLTTTMIFFTWLCFVGSVTIRFFLNSTEIDDMQIYTLITFSVFSCTLISTRAYVMHYSLIMQAKNTGKQIERKDHRNSARIWKNQSNSQINLEISDSVSRQEIDLGLTYISFMTEVDGRIFEDVDGYRPDTISVDRQSRCV